MNNINKVRLTIIFFFFFALYLLGLANLFVIQIKKSTFYENIAKQQYHISITKTPPRAHIYDRNGQPLALNRDSFAAFIIPNNLKESDTTTAYLKKQFPRAHKQLNKNKKKHFMYIKRRLTPQEKQAIESANIQDIQFLKEPNRFYPVKSLGHTVGITNIDNTGISGIELMCDKQLAGEPSTYVLEKDARSNHFYFKKETAVQGAQGKPVKLTLDSDLQFLTYDELKNHVEELGAKEGSAIILDASGDILSMACYPDFDPNKPAPKNLFKTKNRIITEVHEPGSVMKIFPAMAALEEEVVTPEEIIDCENKKETYVNGIRVSTWKAFGKINFRDVIRTSNNIGTSKVNLRLGKQLYSYLKDCGFAQKTGVCFMGEQPGFITPPHKWSKATPVSLSFGYEISASPLHIACGFGLLANDGKPIKPRLFIDPVSETPTPRKQAFSQQTVDQMREIISLDTDSYVSKLGNLPGYNVMGKTGTAYLLTNGKYDTKRSIYTFTGIVEKDGYKRIVSVSIREPKPTGRPTYASTVAVPLFKRIAQSMVIHDKVI